VTFGQPPNGDQGQSAYDRGAGPVHEYDAAYGHQQYARQPYPPADPFPGSHPGAFWSQPNSGAHDPRDLTLPLYGATFGQAVSRFFRNYANFSGRASKSEYWWPVLASLVAIFAFSMATSAIAAAAVSDSNLASGVAALVTIVFILGIALPSISVSVRRLHDANLSGWMYLLACIPILNYVAWIVIGVLSTNPEGARFDRPPW
jgi:uncharacterized membrane protein YhaH (DUF805 family)